MVGKCEGEPGQRLPFFSGFHPEASRETMKLTMINPPATHSAYRANFRR